MLSINEIKLGKVIKVNDQPYVITKADHHKMARGGAVLKTKLKNLIDSSVLEKTFQGNDKAEEADVEKKKVNYMYSDENKAYFMDNESYDQFELSLDVIGDKTKFMKDGTDVDVLYFQDKPVAVELPIKMDFAVTEAPPGVKGDSASNVTKQITIETGAKLNAPLFINEGDRIRVNTDTGEYVERAK
jgi:elongation factor P